MLNIQHLSRSACLWGAGLTCAVGLAGCANTADLGVDENPSDLRAFAEHLRVSVSGRFVEFDGIVPLDAHDEETPIVYLELVACSPDTREHESLVMTRAQPSMIHAALILTGLEPGSPGGWRRDGDGFAPVSPTGSAVEVTITYTSKDGEEIVAAAQDWIVDHETGRAFDGAEWVFAGSRIVEYRGNEYYDANGAGNIIGLTTFGSEVIAWGDVYSHEASVDEPSWIVNASLIPVQGTSVVVRIAATSESSEN